MVVNRKFYFEQKVSIWVPKLNYYRTQDPFLGRNDKFCHALCWDETIISVKF